MKVSRIVRVKVPVRAGHASTGPLHKDRPYCKNESQTYLPGIYSQLACRLLKSLVCGQRSDILDAIRLTFKRIVLVNVPIWPVSCNRRLMGKEYAYCQRESQLYCADIWPIVPTLIDTGLLLAISAYCKNESQFYLLTICGYCACYWRHGPAGRRIRYIASTTKQKVICRIRALRHWGWQRCLTGAKEGGYEYK